jgi:hypothetical protein
LLNGYPCGNSWEFISDGNRKEYHNNQTYGNKYEQKYRTISHEKQPWEIDMNINIRLPSK